MLMDRARLSRLRRLWLSLLIVTKSWTSGLHTTGLCASLAVSCARDLESSVLSAETTCATLSSRCVTFVFVCVWMAAPPHPKLGNGHLHQALGRVFYDFDALRPARKDPIRSWDRAKIVIEAATATVLAVTRDFLQQHAVALLSAPAGASVPAAEAAGDAEQQPGAVGGDGASDVPPPLEPVPNAARAPVAPEAVLSREVVEKYVTQLRQRGL